MSPQCRVFHQRGLRPVFVLTSDVTVSAAGTLLLSLRALPNVTHLGATTRGALSDVLTKPLLNGWEGRGITLIDREVGD